MKTQMIKSALFFALLTTFASCSVIGGIFKAGMGVGILIVVVIIAIIIFAIVKLGNK
jgi:hypothetical protein